MERVPVFAKQAGANIVSSNMAGSNSGVNAMVEGRVQNCNKNVAWRNGNTWKEGLFEDFCGIF